MATVHQITTAEQLLEAPDLGRCELVRGELVMMSPAGFEHGVVAGRIYGHLFNFVEQSRLGLVTAAETGFLIGRNPDTVPPPDVGFVRADRVPKGRTTGYFEGAPDLAVEVLSPGDRAGEVLRKVQDWLAAGCRAVWVADPASQTMSVYRDRRETMFLAITDQLTCDDVLPDFHLALADVVWMGYASVRLGVCA